MTGAISIVLADDHQVVRQALKTLLDAEDGFSVVGEAADGFSALEEVERLRPDVLVADLVMPGLGGAETARRALRRFPETRVVILSMHVDECHVIEALRSGARAYVRKDASANDLIRSIREVAEGRFYLSPPFSERAVEAYRRRGVRSEGADALASLTEREREVLPLTAEGIGNAEVGRRLGISPRTAETHRANIMRKLGLRRSADLIRFAIRRGILPLDGLRDER